MSRAIIAVDCDLRNVYAWCSICGQVCREEPDLAAVREHTIHHSDDAEIPLILFEIASPVSFLRGGQASNQMYQLARWGLWNMAQAAELASETAANFFDLRVAPSNVWTKGHDLATRHKIAGATARKKDLRECQAMLFFHQHAPGDWKTLAEYLDDL